MNDLSLKKRRSYILGRRPQDWKVTHACLGGRRKNKSEKKKKDSAQTSKKKE